MRLLTGLFNYLFSKINSLLAAIRMMEIPLTSFRKFHIVTFMDAWNSLYEVLDTASFLRCSMNTCKLTSSVRTGAPAASWPHANMLLWVWDGFTLDSKKRAYRYGNSKFLTSTYRLGVEGW